MVEYRLEVKHGQDFRHVEADKWSEHDGWLIFWRCPPQGGVKEYWRIQRDCVISMETRP